MLLCIFDHVVEASGLLELAQKTHNVLSLVSKRVHELVRRVRYKTLFVPTAEKARLLLRRSDKALRATIRGQLRGIELGDSSVLVYEAESDAPFAELLAVLGGAGSRLASVTANGIELRDAFFWTIRQGKS